MNEEFKRLLPGIVRELGDHLDALINPGELRSKAMDGESSGYIQSVIGFRGSLSGKLTLIAPDPLCIDLAANILGLGRNDSRTHAYALDAFKTLASAACARVLELLVGVDHLCELILPSAAPLSSALFEQFGRSGDAICFTVKEHTMFLRLELECCADADPCACR